MLLFGKNNSGKSTTMKKIALIVILAQAGCFVPAEYAKLSIFNQILGKMHNFECLEEGKGEKSFELK